MTAEEYRQRMMQAFRNAGTDELIAVCVLPTEKEFDAFTNMLTKNFDKYIDYYVKYSPYEGKYILHAQFRVLKKLPKYEAKIITRGNCMFCGKELTEGLFFCKECKEKSEANNDNNNA